MRMSTLVDVFASSWYRSIAREARNAIALVSSVSVGADAMTRVGVWMVAFVDIFASIIGKVRVASVSLVTPADVRPTKASSRVVAKGVVSAAHFQGPVMAEAMPAAARRRRSVGVARRVVDPPVQQRRQCQRVLLRRAVLEAQLGIQYPGIGVRFEARRRPIQREGLEPVGCALIPDGRLAAEEAGAVVGRRGEVALEEQGDADAGGFVIRLQADLHVVPHSEELVPPPR